jgi:hypothetical protein
VRPLLLFLLLAAPLTAQDPPQQFPQRPIMDLPKASKAMYLNRTGDCVQDSIGMNGAYRADYNAASLLWDTQYGRKQLGGSGPSRVAGYCRARGIDIYNVTGRSVNDTLPWMEWACKTGRFAAIGAFGNHFQTLYGRDYERDLWYVQNNWSGTFDKAYEYTPAKFRQVHAASGPWVVILKGPPPAPNPRY